MLPFQKFDLLQTFELLLEIYKIVALKSFGFNNEKFQSPLNYELVPPRNKDKHHIDYIGVQVCGKRQRAKFGEAVGTFLLKQKLWVKKKKAEKYRLVRNYLQAFMDMFLLEPSPTPSDTPPFYIFFYKARHKSIETFHNACFRIMCNRCNF